MGKTKKSGNTLKREIGWMKNSNKRIRGGANVYEYYFNGSQWVRRFIVSDPSDRRVSFNIAVIVVKLPIFTEPSSSLDTIFLPVWTNSQSFIREASFRFFTHWCIFIRSSLFSLFRTFPRSFPCFTFTYHLIRKMHGSWNNINDAVQLSRLLYIMPAFFEYFSEAKALNLIRLF